MYDRFSYFSIMLIHMSAILLRITAILDCRFILADKKVSRVLVLLFNFLLFEKMDQRNYINRKKIAKIEHT